MMAVYQFENLKLPGLTHGLSTKDFGNLSFIWGEELEVKANRQRFFEALGVDQNQVVVASLEHKANILDVQPRDRGKGVTNREESVLFDILVTDKPDTYLFMVVADCLALFLFEPDKEVCALAHAGWRGVDQEVPRLTVEHMVKQYGCNPAKILVGMSPAIQAHSYQLAEAAQADEQKYQKWQPYLSKDSGFYHIDSVGFAYQQFLLAGITKENIENSQIDTYTDKRFFSSRRQRHDQEREGRFGALIGFSQKD